MALIKEISIGVSVNAAGMAAGVNKATSSLKGFQSAAQSVNASKINQAFSGAGANQFAASMGQATYAISRFIPGLDTAISAFQIFKGALSGLAALKLPQAFSGTVTIAMQAGFLKMAGALAFLKLNFTGAMDALVNFTRAFKTAIMTMLWSSTVFQILDALVFNLIAGLGDLWDAIKSASISGFFSTLGDVIHIMAITAMDGLKGLGASIKSVWALMNTPISFQGIANALEAGIDALVSGFFSAMSALRSGAVATWKAITSGFSSAWSAVKSIGTTSIASLTTAFVVATAAVLATGVAITAVFTKGAKEAAAYNQEVNKAQVLFGQGSQQLTAYADQQAKQYGLVKTAALEAASSFAYAAAKQGQSQEQALATGIELTNMAKDLAAIGGSVEEAATAIKAGLRGEADPLERYGVIMKASAVDAQAAAMGLKRVNGELSNQQKFEASLALLRKETSPLKGLADKTAGASAKQMEQIGGKISNIWIDIGLAIQPITDRVLTFVNVGLGAISGWFSANKDSAKEWFEAFASAGGVAATIVDIIVTPLTLLADLGQIIYRVFATAVTGVADLFYQVVKGIGWVIDTAIAGYDYLSGKEKRKGPGFAEGAEQLAGPAHQNFMEAGGNLLSMPGNTQAWMALKGQATAAIAAGQAGAGAKLPAMGTAGKTEEQVKIEASNEKYRLLIQAITDYEEKLDEQIATTGLAADTAEIFKLKQMGATAAELENAKAKQDELEFLKEEKKAQEEIDNLNIAMDAEIATVGMATEAAQLYRLEMKGVSEESLEIAKALQYELAEKKKAAKEAEDLKEKAKKVAEETRSPLEFYQDEFRQLKQMFSEGLITQGQFVKGEKGVFEEATGKLPKGTGETKLASLMAVNSKEALDYQAKILSGNTKDRDQQALENGREQLTTQRGILETLKKMGGGGLVPVPFPI